ncbi:hypothetical protein DYB32_007059 [Aphanomyces invadans]|nr:hypothetical protein DYB32_007059 [Aphanomyces invadans]
MCTDRRKGTHVVVKRVKARRTSPISHECQMHRLLMNTESNEVAAHQHILTLHDDFIQQGFEHLVLEYCSNGELFDVVEQLPGGRCEVTLARCYFAQICDAVQFMHGRGIAHCDLSLENVLVDANGVLKVSDFGLSIETDERRDHAVGKQFYMAPEMHSGESYDPVFADLWSLGVMLFIMLTGSPPVESSKASDSVMRFVRQHSWRALVHAWQFDDLVPEDALDLLESLLQLEPSNRCSLAHVMAHPFLHPSKFPSVSSGIKDSLLIHKIQNTLHLGEPADPAAPITIDV